MTLSTWHTCDIKSTAAFLECLAKSSYPGCVNITTKWWAREGTTWQFSRAWLWEYCTCSCIPHQPNPGKGNLAKPCFPVCFITLSLLSPNSYIPHSPHLVSNPKVTKSRIKRARWVKDGSKGPLAAWTTPRRASAAASSPHAPSNKMLKTWAWPRRTQNAG